MARACEVCWRAALRACASCSVAVCDHCYGAPPAPAEEAGWRCKPCALGGQPPACRLCGRRGGAQLPVSDAAGGFCHVLCAAMVPGPTVDPLLGMIAGVALVPRRG